MAIPLTREAADAASRFSLGYALRCRALLLGTTRLVHVLLAAVTAARNWRIPLGALLVAHLFSLPGVPGAVVHYLANVYTVPAVASSDRQISTFSPAESYTMVTAASTEQVGHQPDDGSLHTGFR